ncbi:PTS galactitol transporter subunit IIC [Erysipelothrix sp. HDW6A]|uniref:PTS galactitol transporter subunit IIC n=1 Tax=Erysipelothrix sp. HDW6A TaxID=2714928 RepID=UPI001409A2A3|nr:PTS transporter subunit IIC [Erysipelothrix sp. HDW6A]QIK56920.1 PTS galactitol transporter subunit IIC [Erysipelothrix sp. HDW6A]
MQILLDSVNWIIGLGATVFLPIIMTCLGLVFGLKFSKSLRSGITLGIAFTAINLFISQLLVGQIAPAANQMIENAGLQLTALDVGWTAASMISWAWPYAAAMFPIQILVNLVLLYFGLTKTLNVDLWNVWYKIFTAAVIYHFTDNILLSFGIAIVVVIVELKLGDYIAPRAQQVSGIPDITVPHFSTMLVLLVMPFLAFVDRIPFLNKFDLDSKTVQKKMGFLSDPVLLGTIMGILIGAIAGYDVAATLKLGIVVATVTLVIPRIASIFSEALMPISEAASTYMKKKFPDREFYIGLDWPVLSGNPAVITSSVALVPVLVILSMILPGNKTLPFGDIANFASLLVAPAVLLGGNVLKTMIVSIPILMGCLWGLVQSQVPLHL